MRRTRMAALAAAGAITIGASPSVAQDKPFRSMAMGDGRKTLCEIPEPPASLTPTIGHEDAYTYWLEKLELERRLETGACECQVDTISWEEVGKQALPWLADTSQMFIVMRREIEEEIEVLRLAVLAECAG